MSSDEERDSKGLIVGLVPHSAPPRGIGCTPIKIYNWRGVFLRQHPEFRFIFPFIFVLFLKVLNVLGEQFEGRLPFRGSFRLWHGS